MRLVKCKQNHVYDADKFGMCPQCSNRKMEPEELEMETSQVGVDTYKPEQGEFDYLNRRKVTGCLVCIEGEMQGDGFFLKEGINYIGRVSGMEVALSREVTVSKERHASITYDKETGHHTLQVLKNKDDIAYNGRVIKKSCRLKNRGIIQVGACRLLFITFCDSSFSWS